MNYNTLPLLNKYLLPDLANIVYEYLEGDNRFNNVIFELNTKSHNSFIAQYYSHPNIQYLTSFYKMKRNFYITYDMKYCKEKAWTAVSYDMLLSEITYYKSTYVKNITLNIEGGLGISGFIKLRFLKIK